MRFLFVLFISSVLIACGAKDLKPDGIMPAIKANYPTAEFNACGKLWHGLGVCMVEPGKPFQFTIQTYYVGSVMVAFSNGQQNIIESYAQNTPLTVDVDPYEKNHVVTFVVTPVFKESTQKIESFIGHLYLKHNKRPTLTYVGKYRPDSKEYIKLPFDQKADVLMLGCNGEKYLGTEINPVDNFVKLALSVLEPKKSKVPCAYEGGIKPSVSLTTEYLSRDMSKESFLASSEAKEIAWFASVYDPAFVPLEIPSVRFQTNNRRQIVVEAAEEVSILALDDKLFSGESKTTFNFDENKDHILRALTVKGRSAIGVYKSATKQWEWMH